MSPSEEVRALAATWPHEKNQAGASLKDRMKWDSLPCHPGCRRCQVEALADRLDGATLKEPR